jgi:hypothetical protein
MVYQSREWLNKLKVAILKEDFDLLQTLVEQKIEFNNLEEIEEAKYLLLESLKLSIPKRESLSQNLKKIEKNIKLRRNELSTPFHKIDKRF